MTNDVASPAKTLRPSRDLYKKSIRRDLWIGVPLLVLIAGSQLFLQIARANRSGDDSDRAFVWMYVGILVAGIAFAFIFYFSVMRNLRIELGATSLDATNGAGRTRTVEYSEVGTVIQGLIRLPARTLPMLFLLDHEGKRVLTMYGTVWLPESMLAVGSATGIAPTTFPDAISYQELRKLYPNAISWARANPIALAAIVAGGIFLVFIIAMVVLFATLMSSLNA